MSWIIFFCLKKSLLASKDEEAIQSAFFWEISTRNRPKPSQRMIHNEAGAGERERFKSFRNDRKPKRFNKGNVHPKEHSNHSNKPENKSDKIEKLEEIAEKQLPPQTLDTNSESNTPAVTKETKPFRRNKYRNRFRRPNNRPKKPQGEGSQSGNISIRKNFDNYSK